MDFETKVLNSWCCELSQADSQVDEAICEASKVLVALIFNLVPECPERTLAVRRLQESRMWIRQAYCACDEA